MAHCRRARAIRIDHLKGIAQAAARIFKRNRRKLVRIRPRDGFAVGRPEAARENAGNFHHFGEPGMDLFVHGAGLCQLRIGIFGDAHENSPVFLDARDDSRRAALNFQPVKFAEVQTLAELK